MKKAIDISSYQIDVDYEKVKSSGIDMVILRAGYTGYGIEKSKNKDTMFETHYKGFTEVGIPIGVYWYSCAYSENEAIIEAKNVLKIIQNKKISLPVFIDVEDDHNINEPGCSRENQVTIGKQKLTSIVNAFCETIETAGEYVGIYASTYWLETMLNMNILNKYDVWVAHWWVSKPTYKGKYGMWQYSSTGKVRGINGNVDMDYVYKDYPTIIKENNLNNYQNNNTNDLFYIVKSGDTLIGIASKFNKNWKEIYENNRNLIGDNPDLIIPGQKLKI